LPNSIKYSTSAQTLALKKGNFFIGTGDVGKGPSDVTGYYNGVSPSSGGYTVYLNREGAPGDLSYASIPNDEGLVAYTNNLAGTNYTTANECLVYFAGQSDKICVNRDYEGIVTDGLVLNLDAGFTPSYPRSGTTWTDLSLSGNNGTLVNGPTFDSGNGGSIVFDGTNDYVNLNLGQNISDQSFTLSFFFKNLSTSDWTDFVTLLNPSNTRVFVFEKGGNNGFPLTNGYLKVYPFGVSSLVGVLVPGLLVNDSNIHSFTITSSSTSWNLYGDGLLYGTGPISGPAQSFNRVNIATDISRSNRFCKNQNYLTQIYNRALSSAEILQNYNAQKSRFGL
jgi:hypothetical protein